MQHLIRQPAKEFGFQIISNLYAYPYILGITHVNHRNTKQNIFKMKKIKRICNLFLLTFFLINNVKAQTVSTFYSGLDHPFGIAIDNSQNIYVVEGSGGRVKKISPNGTLLATYYNPAIPSSYYTNVRGVTVDNNGNVFVAEDRRIIKYTSTTSSVIFNPTAYLQTMTGLVFDPISNSLFIVDYHLNQIKQSTMTGTITTFAGNGNLVSLDGVGTAAGFSFPQSVAIDTQGNLYTTENSNRIKKITPTAVVTTIAGNSGVAGSLDGPASTATFNLPRGIAVDNSGNLFITEYGNNKIRKLSSNGVVSTYAGSGTAGHSNGQALSASFEGLSGIVVDASGNLYVTEVSAGTIRKITSPLSTRTIKRVGHATAINTRAFGMECSCGNWTVKKIIYRDAVEDFVCNGSKTIVNNTSANFILQYNCNSTTNCAVKYEAVITTPAGQTTTVQIANNQNWNYAFSQVGNYMIVLRTYCNGVLCSDSCTYTITVK